MHTSELNQRELALGITPEASWHQEFADTNWIFVGGLPLRMTEGDLLVMFSQYGTVIDVQLARDRKTGKSKGFAFIEYEEHASTILAVDNFDGVKMMDRVLTVNHRRYERKNPPTPLEVLYKDTANHSTESQI